MSHDEVFARLEASIRKLQVDYDSFLSGGMKLPPIGLQQQIEGQLRRMSNVPMRTIERFRFNTILGRFNTYSELWAKRLRNVEEGRETIPGRRAPGMQPSPERGGGVVVGDPAAAEKELGHLYERWLAARRAEGETPKVSKDSFLRQIAKQAAGLRESHGVSEVEFRLEQKDGHTTLSARPLAAATPQRSAR